MGAKYGFLIPDSYVRKIPEESVMNISSIFWGFSLGVGLFSAVKAASQTMRSWQRSGRVSVYVAMIWGVWLSSMLLGVLSWCFQRQYINPSFAFYFHIALFWAIQVQLLLQIIINRLGLLMFVPGQATRIKWIVFAIILAVNISVFIIWMPARLQINDTWIHLNVIWDRCEKVIFAVVDFALNGYFIYLVRSRLIENGLSKYLPLYHMNLALIFLSLSLDVVLIGLMSLKSSLVYLSFHPVCYLLKLQIEMIMAELITKIVRSSSIHQSGDTIGVQSSAGGKSKIDSATGKSKFSTTLVNDRSSASRGGDTTQVIGGDIGGDIDIELGGQSTHPEDMETGVVKTVQTIEGPAKEREDEEAGSTNSSILELHYRSKHQ
ncbi:hypothetical protein B0J13DRAFT_635185 [Dactylonectria estremocensis]|uniref:Uncharacterized protein n=1 Tax=Dactylonectria estremocensis TaxID=1079267 RepID=A0A9P9ETT6_9HYPO|nr:hypothetical protein B0J13DRAFT_635185 [Dactylonectria estremocensis]